MAGGKQTVLITGCSDGGLGAALAIAFHEAGFHVYATARDPAKMKQLTSLGIQTLTLDVQSEESIAACVKELSSLDMLVNNAGAAYPMPVVDIKINDAKNLFDLNVWSQVAVTQAFLPLLLKSKGMIVNQTSAAAAFTIPYNAVYAASKAALVMLSDTLRLELEPFGIKVVDLRTGLVKTNLIPNIDKEKHSAPKGSIYEPAREIFEKGLRQEQFVNGGMDANIWAKGVAHNLLSHRPSRVIWSGESSWLNRLATFLPCGWLDGQVKKLTGFDVVAEILRQY